MKTCVAAALLGCLLTLPVHAEEAAKAGEAGKAEPERWLLVEFDWGDSRKVVYETVHYTDGFVCYRHKLREHCAFVKTLVDGEELLANFEFVDDRLWRIDILTPDLDATVADPHLERVWRLLAAYVTRFYGEAPEQTPYPDRESLAVGELRVTHRWQLPDQEIQVLVGRSRDAAPKWFTAAHFIDPKWAKAKGALQPRQPAPAKP